ncbi:hypothetical protein M0R72_00390 [Candidatus Pacearchaeota archaeon]|jgi:hypothetical protein|nr:hypothetical protein [Candidatus Pacearchaeota archaeon]
MIDFIIYKQADQKKVFPKGFGTLESAVKEAHRQVMFKDEKNWRSVYTRGYANHSEEDYTH